MQQLSLVLELGSAKVFGRPKLQNQAELLDTVLIKIAEDKNLL